MNRSKIWIILMVSAISSGILLGILLFAVFNSGNDHSGSSDSTESHRHSPSPGPSEKPDPTPETEDFSAYYGTYVPKDGRNLVVDLGGEAERVSRPHEISPKALLYIDQVRRTESGMGLQGYIDYFGLQQWVYLDDLTRISVRDYSIHTGDTCIVCENWAEVPLLQTPEKGGVTFGISFQLGDLLQVLDVQNGFLSVNTQSGVSGWVDGDYVTRLHTEFPYQIAYRESNSTSEIQFYRDFPGSTNIALGEADGSIEDGSVLWFDQFSDGWGHTQLGGSGAWISMVNAVPAPDTWQQVVMGYKVYAADPTPSPTPTPTPTPAPVSEGRTDFYKDGRTVGVGDFILPAAQQRYLTDSDLENLTLKGLSYAKNELYAKYGREFEAKELKAYMNTKTWYTPRYEPRTYDDQIVDQLMNAYEKQNIVTLRKKEDALGPYEYDKK